MTATTEGAEAPRGPGGFRWCAGGDPGPDRLGELQRDAAGLGPGLVVCGCRQPWACGDPETLSRAEESALRRQRRTLPGARRPAGKHWSAYRLDFYESDLPGIG